MGKLSVELRRNDSIMVNIRRKNYQRKKKTRKKGTEVTKLRVVRLALITSRLKRKEKRRVFSHGAPFQKKRKKRRKEKNLRGAHREERRATVVAAARRSEVNRPSRDRVHADAAGASSSLSRQVAPSTW